MSIISHYVINLDVFFSIDSCECQEKSPFFPSGGTTPPFPWIVPVTCRWDKGSQNNLTNKHVDVVGKVSRREGTPGFSTNLWRFRNLWNSRVVVQQELGFSWGRNVERVNWNIKSIFKMILYDDMLYRLSTRTCLKQFYCITTMPFWLGITWSILGVILLESVSFHCKSLSSYTLNLILSSTSTSENAKSIDFRMLK